MADVGEVDQLIDAWFSAELERQWQLFGSDSFAAALMPPGADSAERRRVTAETTWRDAELRIQRLSEAQANGRFRQGLTAARAIIRGMAAPIPEGSQDFAVLCKRVMEAEGEIEEARIRWAEGAIEYRPPLPSAFKDEAPRKTESPSATSVP